MLSKLKICIERKYNQKYYNLLFIKLNEILYIIIIYNLLRYYKINKLSILQIIIIYIHIFNITKILCYRLISNKFKKLK